LRGLFARHRLGLPLWQLLCAAGLFVTVGAILATTFGAPPAEDRLRPVEVTALLLTLGVVAWSTLEVQRQRRTSQAQLEVSKGELEIARAAQRQEISSAVDRAAFIAYGIRRQILGWIELDGDEGSIVPRRLRSPLLPDEFNVVEQRLERLASLRPLPSHLTSAIATLTAAYFDLLPRIEQYRAIKEEVRAGFERSEVIERVVRIVEFLESQLVGAEFLAAEREARERQTVFERLVLGEQAPTAEG
jgi:hypothetical protein